MARATVTLLAIWGSIILALVGLGCQEYDCFYCCELDITTDRSDYTHGDVMTLTATVTPRESSRIQLYSDIEKSFCIILRSMVGDSVDFNDNDFWRRTHPTPADPIDTIAFSPTTPFILKIEGHINVEADSSVRFDFGKFGSFTKRRVGKFLIKGYWDPIHPKSGDSREDYTNEVHFTVLGKP